MLIKTGIERLDELMKGGIPAVTNTMLYSPPFIGKENILNKFVLSGLEGEEPVIFVLTDKSFSEMRKEMEKLDKNFPRYESEGKVKYIDIYSKGVELKEEGENVIFVDSPINRERITSDSVLGCKSSVPFSSGCEWDMQTSGGNIHIQHDAWHARGTGGSNNKTPYGRRYRDERRGLKNAAACTGMRGSYIKKLD